MEISARIEEAEIFALKFRYLDGYMAYEFGFNRNKWFDKHGYE